jgi:transcriptional regulator with XRE-family HTH domain
MQNFKELLKAAKENWQFKAEEQKLNLALAFNKYMKKLNWNNADLARELGTSRAYITKIMRGDQNLSIDKITEIADALGADAHFHLSEKGTTGQWLEFASVANKNRDFKKSYAANQQYAGSNLITFEDYTVDNAA